MLGDGWEAVPDVRMVGMPSRMSGSVWEALPNVPVWWEALSNVRQFLGGPLSCPGVVGTPSQLSESDREALPNVREWPGGLQECPRVVGRPSQMSGSVWEAFPDFWQ